MGLGSANASRAISNEIPWSSRESRLHVFIIVYSRSDHSKRVGRTGNLAAKSHDLRRRSKAARPAAKPAHAITKSPAPEDRPQSRCGPVGQEAMTTNEEGRARLAWRAEVKARWKRGCGG